MMTKEEIIEMAFKAGFVDYELDDGTTNAFDKRYEAFAKLVAEKKREAILQMFEHAPALVDFAKNDQGGCLICGFTPEIAIKSIRARGDEA